MKEKIQNLCFAAMFLALGLVLPFLTGQIPEIGNMLCPMHIPVLLCGLICGWKYGFTVGAITPIMRSLIFGMPPLFPTAFAMAFELATYGLVIGILFKKSKWKCLKALYRSLIIAMLCGRAVWGIVECCILGFGEGGFTLAMFFTSSVLNAIPGIVLQLVLIPSVMLILGKTHIRKKRKCE